MYIVNKAIIMNLTFQKLIKMRLLLISTIFLTSIPFVTLSMFPCLLVDTTIISEVEKLH